MKPKGPVKLAKALIIGPTPPPHHGVSVATRVLLDSRLSELFDIIHVDLADRRGIAHVDNPDFHDVLLFVKQLCSVLLALFFRKPSIVYIPLSQRTVGFIRDSIFLWAAHLFGSKVIVHLHGANFRVWYEGLDALSKRFVEASLRPVAMAIVLGECLKPIFQGLAPREKITVVPNGLDLPETGAGATGDCGERKGCRVLYLGALSCQKGVFVLLDAAFHVLQSRSDVRFIFAGSWASVEQREKATSFVSEKGISGSVEFVGPVQGGAKKKLYESSDLFVFPGIQQEGQPLVVIEAMAAGLPILFTNRGCLRETVLPFVNGLELRLGDAGDLAQKILWLLRNPLEMKRMGVESRKRYEDMYTAKRFTEKMIGVFSSVVSEKPAKGGRLFLRPPH